MYQSPQRCGHAFSEERGRESGRLMPVFLNLGNDGQSWCENRVPLETVCSVNAAIGNACPDVWAYAKALLAR